VRILFERVVGVGVRITIYVWREWERREDDEEKIMRNSGGGEKEKTWRKKSMT